MVTQERVGLVVSDTPQAFALAVKQLFDDAALSANKLSAAAASWQRGNLTRRFLGRE